MGRRCWQIRPLRARSSPTVKNGTRSGASSFAALPANSEVAERVRAWEIYSARFPFLQQPNAILTRELTGTAMWRIDPTWIRLIDNESASVTRRSGCQRRPALTSRGCEVPLELRQSGFSELDHPNKSRTPDKLPEQNGRINDDRNHNGFSYQQSWYISLDALPSRASGSGRSPSQSNYRRRPKSASP